MSEKFYIPVVGCNIHDGSGALVVKRTRASERSSDLNLVAVVVVLGFFRSPISEVVFAAQVVAAVSLDLQRVKFALRTGWVYYCEVMRLVVVVASR